MNSNNKSQLKIISSVLALCLAGPALSYAKAMNHCVSSGHEKSVLANSLKMDYSSLFDTQKNRFIELVNTNPQKVDITLSGDVGTFGTLSKSKYYLSKGGDIAALTSHVLELIELGQQQKIEKENAKQQHAKYQAPLLEISSDINAALEELLVLLNEYKVSANQIDCERTIFAQIAEITNAINNNYTEPVVSKIFIDDEFLMGWLSHINEPGQSARKENVNIVESYQKNSDTSAIDPQDSPLWIQKKISSENTQIGFGRKKMINIEGVIFKYDKPKTGFGTRPGIRIVQKVKGGKDLEYKVRIDIEAKTGPFLARLGNALGFSTYALDYAKEIDMLFTTKFFTEYHSRKSFGESVYKDLQAEKGNFDGLNPVIVTNRQREWNPFEVVISAKMKDNTIISGEELKAKLFKGQTNKTDLSNPNNYDEAFAAQIETFKIGPVSLELLDENEISIGSWGFNSLGHHDLREARGLTILAAWLSLHDLRKDNTRLMILKDEQGNKRLQMRLSDWGSGLGTARGHILGFKNLQGDLMADKIVEVDNANRKVKVLEFKPNQPSFASDLMSYDDAKWMARKIGQLTEKQMDSAMAVAGFSAAEFVMYKHKLLMRRNNLISAFGLEKEYGLMQTEKPVNFSSDLNIQLLDNSVINIKANGDQITAGKLILKKSIAASQDKKEAAGDLFKVLGDDGLPRLLRKILLVTPDEKIGEISILAQLMKEKESSGDAAEHTAINPIEKIQKLTQMVSVIITMIQGEQDVTKKIELTRKTSLLLKSFGQTQAKMILQNIKNQLPATIWFLPNPAVVLINTLMAAL